MDVESLGIRTWDIPKEFVFESAFLEARHIGGGMVLFNLLGTSLQFSFFFIGVHRVSRELCIFNLDQVYYIKQLLHLNV